MNRINVCNMTYIPLKYIINKNNIIKNNYHFSDIFTQTFYDAKYDNVVFVTKGSINFHDEVFDEYKTIVQSSENSMIRYSVLNIRYVIMTVE